MGGRTGRQRDRRTGLFDVKIPPGLDDTAVYGVAMTGLWLVGRGLIGLAFGLFVALVGFTPVFRTFEFGVVALFSLILISRFESFLVQERVTLVHVGLLLGMWTTLLPVWFALQLGMQQFIAYGLIGTVSVVWLMVIEESRTNR